MADNVVQKLKDAIEGIVSDRKTVVKILSVLLILVIAAAMRIYDAGRSDISIETEEPAEESQYSEELSEEQSLQTQVICVDIGGAVEEPGVYQVAKDTRLYEVIEMAGGLTENADTDSVNRASCVR